MIDAFCQTMTSRLTNHEVAFVESDVVGAAAGSYRQVYHYARVGDGQADGEGSCRCLLTRLAGAWSEA